MPSAVCCTGIQCDGLAEVSGTRQRVRDTAVRSILLAGILSSVLAPHAFPQERITFVGVALDMETRLADRKLQDYLTQKANVAFAPEELEYGTVIARLANWKKEEGYFLARTTPYVYVAAEMLGADFETLATYISTDTGRSTYHSYFVVNRKDFPAEPNLFDVIRFMQRKPERAKFIYHNQFSTSSFFLPSLYFRSNKIFQMPESTESLIAISAERIQENSSSKLVEMVANGQADLAAVWDGTKGKFELGRSGDLYERFGKQVYFVQLPTALPNDLLVCSASLDSQIKDRLRAAIQHMSADEMGVGDFKTWQAIQVATDARLALADLRWLAKERIPPVTVEIRMKAGIPMTTGNLALKEAAIQAVRLSGTELVLYDADFHEHIDVTWTMEPIHDGAVVLRCAIPGSDIPDQLFRISFGDTEDLTKRIVSLIQSRMHRIRYVWSYSGNTPIIIRDIAFSLRAGTTVKVQKISWLDPERNKFRAGPFFSAKIRDSGYYRYELDPDDFARSGEIIADFDAMSNSSYRVVLLRPSDERPLFRILTGILLMLAVGAAIGAIVDLVRLWRMDAQAGLPTQDI